MKKGKAKPSNEPTDGELKECAHDLAQILVDSGADVPALIAYLDNELKKLREADRDG